MARIVVEGMQFYAHHGYYKEEQVLGGQYSVDLYMDGDFSQAEQTDELSYTVDYEKVYSLVKTEMKERSHLIEHIARRIVKSIHGHYNSLSGLKVRVCKFNPPLKGQVNRVCYELEEKFS